jgi:hypothetical protein
MFSFVLFFSIQSLFLQHQTKRTRNGEFSTFIKKKERMDKLKAHGYLL